jgi:radical SAM superfamily enzyme YgiQ (UPF0313 family)
MRVLLISTYDLGRQPFGLASAAASLDAGGVPATCIDLSRDPLPRDAVRDARLVAFFLPMHTATRLALPIIDTVRQLNPAATLCAYGLYAPLNASLLRDHGVAEIIGGEFEDELTALARRVLSGAPVTPDATPAPSKLGAHTPHAARSGIDAVPRVHFVTPLRESLPTLDRYARLQWGSERRLVGYTEASRGCKHRCRHCPIVPVYDGRFRVVTRDVVIEDIRRQIAAGARHITFGDPDFFNGPRHAVEIVRRVAAEFQGISYDVTIKVEHLLAHADLLPVLSETGCAFVTSAVESVDDGVLLRLEKGHTAADFDRVVRLCRAAGLRLSPTFVAFTPWTTRDGYCAMLKTIDRLKLVDYVAPIQLAIRLLIPEGSRLLELEDIRALVGPFDPRSLTYPWVHRDPAVDALQVSIASLVGRRLNATRRELFDEVWDLAHTAAGLPGGLREDAGLLPRAAVPYLNEPWYC